MQMVANDEGSPSLIGSSIRIRNMDFVKNPICPTRDERTSGECSDALDCVQVIKLSRLFEIYGNHVRARIFPSTFPALVRHSSAGPVISAFLILSHSLA